MVLQSMIRSYIPILLSLEDFYNTVTDVLEDDSLIPPIEERTDNIILSPRYYILIYSPVCQNSSSSTNKPLLKIDLHRKGLLKNTVRLSLKPSIGYGINSCYRLEFWKWYPVNVISEAKKPKRLTQEFIKQEYLYIPDINNYSTRYRYYSSTYDSIYYSSLAYRLPFKSIKEITVIRKFKSSGVILDEFLPNQTPLDIFAFNKSDIKPYENIDVDKDKPYDKFVSSLGIEYRGEYPKPEFTPSSNNSLYYGQEIVNGEIVGSIAPITYSVEYIRPLKGIDVVQKDEPGWDIPQTFNACEYI